MAHEEDNLSHKKRTVCPHVELAEHRRASLTGLSPVVREKTTPSALNVALNAGL